MNAKLELAKQIFAGETDFSVYMMCQPTRGPKRNQELTREQLLECYAASRTTAQLKAELAYRQR